MLIIMSERKDEFDLFKWHPELVLVSRSPYSLEGFLSLLDNCNVHGRSFLRIKLLVPLYPSLKDMAIYFTKNFNQSLNSNLKRLIFDSIRNKISLLSFLNHLKEYFTLQAKCDCDYGNYTPSESIVYESMKKRLSELRELLLRSSEIKVSSNHDMKIIKLTANGVSVIVENKEGTLWKIINSEIPNLLEDKSIENTPLSLNQIYNIFSLKLDSLKSVWTGFKEIDTECWVMDPVHPKPHHLYRRIYIAESLSLVITFDPCYLSGAPNVKLLGCESEVSKYDTVLERIQLWNPEYSLLQNLCLLLNINKFPQAPKKRNVEVDVGIVNDDECCICYEKELDNQFPNIICNNMRCRKNFHLQCLQQWLDSISGKSTVFDQICGECPHCQEKIMCARK